MTVLNALSVDVEEYYHALVFQEGTHGMAGVVGPSRVEASVERILAFLGARDVRATFFTLGEVARDQPAMVRKIAGAGHEVACHGYRHVLVSGLDRQTFRDDIRRAKSLLEDLTGEAVLGYRAPNFSLGRAGSWPYEVIREEGFRYDSSVYPIRHDRYGEAAAPRHPFPIAGDGPSALLEFPVGTVRVRGVNLPIGGGGYFRLLPRWLVQAGIRRVNRREGRPVMFYFHPWELDPDQPRPPMRWRHRFRHYVGMKREEAKLTRLLDAVRFGTARDVLGLG